MGCNSSSIQPLQTIPQRNFSNDRKFEDSVNLNSNANLSSWYKLIETLESKTNIKDYVLSKKRKSFKSLNDLKAFLLKSPAETEIEKAWTVYLWMTHNIDYNFDGYLNGSYGGVGSYTDSVLKTGLAVCSGYAMLSKNLLDIFNIENITIAGYSKGYGYKMGQKFKSTDHEWNAVCIDNKWHLIESCWGAGYCDDQFHREFQPYYFFTPAEVFIYEHFPTNVENQYLEKSITLNDFELLPKYDIKFFINGFKCLTHSKALIEPVNNQFKMEFEAPSDMNMIGHLETINSSKIDNAVFIQRDYRSNNYVVEISLQSNELVKLCFFGDKINSNSYSGICGFQIKPKNSITSGPLYCTKFSFPSQIYLYEPKENNLKVGHEYTFKVFVAALDVALVDANKTWIHLRKDSSSQNLWYTIYKPIVEGPLNFYAKLSENQSFSGAYKYTVTK